MTLYVSPGYWDKRVIYRRDDQDSNSTSDQLNIDSGSIEAFKKGEEYSEKPIYSKIISVYRTVGPEQLLLDSHFLGRQNYVQADGSFAAMAADFVRRRSEAEPRFLLTPAEIAADEDMILHFGEVADPHVLRSGLNAAGEWITGASYSIWLELECRRGGLRIANEPYPYLAPLDGYSRKLRFELIVSNTTGGQISGLVWIRRTGTPVRYGIMHININFNRGNRGDENSDCMIPFINLWINPSGSRNLERPGPGQFNPHSTPDGSRVMLWRPQPLRLRPDNNLEGEFSDPYTDITQSYGPQWFAEPRQAGAIRLLDDPPEGKKP